MSQLAVWRKCLESSVDSLLKFSPWCTPEWTYCSCFIVGNLYKYFNPPQESLGDVPGVSPGFKWGCSDPDWASLLSLQLSRVLRLLKYPAEDSENPPQVNMSPFVSQVCLKLKLGPNYCSVKTSWCRSHGKLWECLFLLVNVCLLIIIYFLQCALLVRKLDRHFTE